MFVFQDKIKLFLTFRNITLVLKISLVQKGTYNLEQDRNKFKTKLTCFEMICQYIGKSSELGTYSIYSGKTFFKIGTKGSV